MCGSVRLHLDIHGNPASLTLSGGGVRFMEDS